MLPQTSSGLSSVLQISLPVSSQQTARRAISQSTTCPHLPCRSPAIGEAIRRSISSGDTSTTVNVPGYQGSASQQATQKIIDYYTRGGRCKGVVYTIGGDSAGDVLIMYNSCLGVTGPSQPIPWSFHNYPRYLFHE